MLIYELTFTQEALDHPACVFGRHRGFKANKPYPARLDKGGDRDDDAFYVFQWGVGNVPYDSIQPQWFWFSCHDSLEVIEGMGTTSDGARIAYVRLKDQVPTKINHLKDRIERLQSDLKVIYEDLDALDAS